MKNRIHFKHKAYENISPIEYWRFVIDGVLQQDIHQGWLAYESREAGSVKALLQAYADMLNSTSQALTAENMEKYIKQLHRKATESVSLNHNASSKVPVGEYRTDRVNFWVRRGENGSTDGMNELYAGVPREVEFMVKQSPVVESPRPKIYADEYYIEPVVQGAENISKAVNVIIKTYFQKLQNLQDEKLDENTHSDAVLKIIIECVKNLEITHPFADGNSRTFCILLFQRLLLDHGFPPVILHDPNYFDGLTIDQLMEKTKAGILVCQNLATAKPDTKEFIKETMKKWEEKSGKIAPLHFAVTLGIPELVRETLLHVTKIDAKDSNGKTAFMLAAENDDQEIMALLLKASSCCDQIDKPALELKVSGVAAALFTGDSSPVSRSDDRMLPYVARRY